jgi:hypothetical protein
MNPTKPQRTAVIAGLLSLACLTPVFAADIDVVATQTALNATYGVATLSGNQTWTADNVYIMKDRVYVPNGVTLTIEPGTKIYSTVDNKGTTTGSNPTNDDSVGVLIVARGGTINAAGTAEAPIVFDALQTLEAERGVDLPYDPDSIAGPKPTVTTTALWGGVIILGNSSISLVDASQQPVRNDIIEGFTPAGTTDADIDGFSDILEYGYDGQFALDNADNSGVFTYVSIRHGGYNFAPNNEINGLTLGGVGSGTTINNVEVIANEDDGVEFFGGSVNTSHMVVAFCKDDCFDIDQGHSGTHQFWFAIQNPNEGDNLGEWDGVDTNVSGQGSKTDVNVAASNPQIWNATFVGPGSNAFTQASATNDNGLYIDDNFRGALKNSILHDSVNFLASFASDGGGGPAGSFANNTVGEFGKYTTTNVSVLNSAPATFYATAFGLLDGNTAPDTSPAFTKYSRNGASFLTQIDPRPSVLNTTVSAGAPTAAAYRGAFGTSNWAAEWSYLGELGYFGPVIVDVVASRLAPNATYGVNTLASDQTWTADKIYVLKDRVYVPNGVTLTIEPGTRIYSTFDNKGTTTGSNPTNDDSVGVLIVARGGTINAAGTADAPIVFDALQTLEAELGMDLPYDPDSVAGPAPTATTTALWGGVIILGNSSISLVDASQQPVRNDIIEGFTPAGTTDADIDGFSDILEYGYDGQFALDNADNSGVFTYVSIRHGGYNFAPNNEINGLTLGGVGSGTTINHVEVYANEDDGVEFFGGSVNTSHMVVAFCKDDCFDIDQGHSGTHQFWFALQNPNEGDNLGEWDGVDTNVSGQSSKTDANVAASNPQIWNATLVGPGSNAFTQASATNDNGLYLDDNFRGALKNSILHDSVNFLASFASDGGGGPAGSFANNTVGEFGKYTTTNVSVLNSAPATFYATAFGLLDGNTAADTSPAFTKYSRSLTGFLTKIDPRPSVLNTTVSAGAPTAAAYRGAFGTSNWADGWTKLSTSSVLTGEEPATGGPAPFADVDNDGISDTLEATTALTNLGFSAGVNNVSPANLFSSLYTTSSILDLVAPNQVMVQKNGGNVTLSLELFRSTNLQSFTPAPALQATFPATEPAEFYRIEVPGAE